MKKRYIGRREFLRSAGLGAASVFLGSGLAGCAGAEFLGAKSARKPNIVFIFADQWRAQATGYFGDPNAQTPYLDKLAKESINFINAVSGCPV
ncbi:MAG: sulfatase-like hydrolase/transferase, partial [Phycisphaerae bacterium]